MQGPGTPARSRAWQVDLPAIPSLVRRIPDSLSRYAPVARRLLFSLPMGKTSLCRCVALAALVATACIVERVEYRDSPDSDGPGGDGADRGYDDDNLGEAFGGLSDSEADFLRGLLEENADAPGWPAYPRRVAVLSDSFKNETAISVGAKGSFFDLVEAEATASVQFAYGHGSHLMLIKTSEGGLSSLTRVEDGVVYLNYEDGVDFVGQCAYKANLDAGARFAGKVSVSGNGASNTTDLGKATEVLQSTNFFAIQDGDTVDDLLVLCESVFDKRIAHSVGVDLRNLALARISIDSGEIDDTYRAYVAAMRGPARDRLFLMGHHWNIEPASWRRFGPGERRFRVFGRFERDVAVLPNGEVFYDFEYEDGALVSEWVSVDGASGWESVAPDLARMLADEVYGEFRVTLDEVEPGDPPRAQLDGYFFGTGHYTMAGLADAGLANDAVTVVTVPVGLEVTLFESDGFTGAQRVLGPGTHPAPFGVSSLWVHRDPSQMRLYEIAASEGGGSGLADVNGAPAVSTSAGAWGLAPTEDGYARLVHADSGRYLAATATGPILVYAEDADTEWAVVPDGNGSAIVHRKTGQALARDGGELVVSSPDGGGGQRWYFE